MSFMSMRRRRRRPVTEGDEQSVGPVNTSVAPPVRENHINASYTVEEKSGSQRASDMSMVSARPSSPPQSGAVASKPGLAQPNMAQTTSQKHHGHQAPPISSRKDRMQGHNRDLAAPIVSTTHHQELSLHSRPVTSSDRSQAGTMTARGLPDQTSDHMDKSEGREIEKIRFRSLASDRPFRKGRASPYESVRAKVRDVFSPSSPVMGRANLAGRGEEMRRAISAIENERMHIVIHGKRGWGKTSFANTLVEIASEADFIVCRASCNDGIDYSSMFRGFLAQIPMLYDQKFMSDRGAREGATQTFDSLLPEGKFTAQDLTAAMSRLSNTRAIFVLDEFDRADKATLGHSVIETIKSFSDAGVRATLVIVGVADSLDDIMGYHESIRRNVCGISMRLLSKDEFAELIDIGCKRTGLSFSAEARARIAALSQAIPYFARLLCLHAANNALDNERLEVANADISVAAERALEYVVPLVERSHKQLIVDAMSSTNRGFIFAIARVRTAQDGGFSVEDVHDELQRETGEDISHLQIGARLSTLVRQDVGFLHKFMRNKAINYRLQNPYSGFFLRLIEDRARNNSTD